MLKISPLSVCLRVFNPLLFIALLSANPIKADAAQLYAPALQPAPGVTLGLAFVNSGSEEVQLEVIARTYNGGLIEGSHIVNPVILSVPPGVKRALTVGEMFGSGIAEHNGWLEVSTPGTATKVSSLFFNSESKLIESGELASLPSERLIFPKVSMNSGTRLTLVNTAAESVIATISLYENSGLPAGQSEFELGALSGFDAGVSALGSVDDTFEGYAVVTSGGGTLVGAESYQRQSDIAVVRALPGWAQTRIGYWAHFATQTGYNATLTLVNASDEAQILQVTAAVKGLDGAPLLVPQTITVLPNQRLEQDLARLFDLPPVELNGHIRFDVMTETPGVLGLIEYGAADGATLTAVEASSGNSDFVFGHLEESEFYYTGLALLNPALTDAALLLDIFDQDGSNAGSAVINLVAGENKQEFLNSIFSNVPAGFKGYLRVMATEPVVATEFVGSWDGTGLASMTSQTAQFDFSAAATLQDQTPVITSVFPSNVAIDNRTSLSVRVDGSGFTPTGFVNYDGVRIPSFFVNPTLIAFTITGLAAGVHSLNVVNPDGATSNTFAITLTTAGTAPPVNKAPTVSAGSAQTITLPSLANLSGTATDDGLPSGTLTTTWSKFSGPGTVTFGNANALATTASFSTAGSYMLRLTASDAALTSSSDVMITVGTAPQVNQAPTVSAGSAQTITLPSSANLSGTAADDGLPWGVLTTTWSKYSGPGTVTFGNTNALATTASFSTAGSYVLRLTASDAALTSSSDVTITVGTPQVNQAPTVSAGSAQTITFPSSANLSGTATDDGLLWGVLTTTWSKFSGPGAVTFANANALATTASFSTSGSYVLRLTASDGALSNSSDVTITVNAAATSPGGVLTLVTPLTLNATTVTAGETLSATATYQNTGFTAVALNQTVITARRPGATNSSGPFDDFSPRLGVMTVQPGETVTLAASRAFTTSDPIGTWYAFITYQDSNLVWHDGPALNFSVAILSGSGSGSGSGSSSGATYYVSNSGNDSNSGTSTSSPWRTIAKVQSFLPNLRPGDSVLFQRGGIWYEQLKVNNVNGTATARITFGNYGTGSLPIIDGGGTKSGYAVNGGREWCIGGSNSKMSYLTIDGFECRNASSYGIAFVGVSSGSAGIVVQNSYIHDTGNGDFGYHNQLMFAEFNYGHAYGTQFLNNKVGNCYGHNCIQIHGDTGGPLIRGNECYGFTHNCIDVKYVQKALVDNNVVHDGLGIQRYGQAFYLENSTTSYTADVTWTRNVVYGANVTQAFQCQDAGGPVTCYVYNNTVYGNMEAVYGGSDSGQISRVSIHVKNNIFDTPNLKFGGGYVVWDYNDNVQSNPIGSHDVKINPLFVNAGGRDFRLQSGSPVIDKGTNVNLTYTGSAPDLGAFEYGQ